MTDEELNQRIRDLVLHRITVVKCQFFQTGGTSVVRPRQAFAEGVRKFIGTCPLPPHSFMFVAFDRRAGVTRRRLEIDRNEFVVQDKVAHDVIE